MKKIYISLFIVIHYFGFSQTEKLFYYTDKDSLIGVKNQNGKIIIPAKPIFRPELYYDKREIKSDIFTIEFKDSPFSYYDRKGHFLFKTYMTSEGPDGFTEGFIRYQENNKAGIVNDKGKKITLPKYDFITSMNFGYAEYCNGCYRDYSKDEEHAPLVGGVWGFVDRNGKEIKPTPKRNHPKDIETKEHTFIPYQFKYNKKEQEILTFFEKRKDKIIKINGFNCSDKKLFFEIVEKPSEFQPCYVIRTFELCDKYPNGADENYDEFKVFKVSADGKEFYVLYTDLVNHEKYSEYVERKILVDDWIKSNLK